MGPACNISSQMIASVQRSSRFPCHIAERAKSETRKAKVSKWETSARIRGARSCQVEGRRVKQQAEHSTHKVDGRLLVTLRLSARHDTGFARRGADVRRSRGKRDRHCRCTARWRPKSPNDMQEPYTSINNRSGLHFCSFYAMLPLIRACSVIAQRHVSSPAVGACARTCTFSRAMLAPSPLER